MQFEKDILDRSINALREVIQVEAEHRVGFGQLTDETIQLRFYRNGHVVEKTFIAEIKSSATLARLRTMIGQIALLNHQSTIPVLLITEYIPPQIAEQLKELNIAFMDSVGNAYFNEPELLIYINTKARGRENETSKPSLLFQPSGLKLIFALLSKPGSENRPYRELTELSNLSLGSTSEIMSNLTRDNYLIDRKEGRLLLRKDKLVERWTQGYQERLRPKLRKITFQSNNDDWWRTFVPNQAAFQWGGEVAADRMTGYLMPHRFIAYTGQLHQTMRYFVENGFRREPNGDIEVVEKFWNFDDEEELVPPLLVYADLISNLDERSLQAAQIIHDNFIARLIE